MAHRATLLWVLLYTAGLTDAQKTRRRGEIESDMHDHAAFFAQQGVGSAAISRSIASRTMRGVIADILWRFEAGREGEDVVRNGGNPPLPWLTMWFVGAIIVAGALASTQAAWLGDARVLLAFLGAFSAGLLWLGLAVTGRHFLGPLCITGGALGIACGFWWTLAVPFLAVAVGIGGLRRAARLEALLRES